VRWVTFAHGGASRPGVVADDGRVIDIRAATAATGGGRSWPESLPEICGAGAVLRGELAALVSRAPEAARLPAAAARLRPPVERPGKIVCLAGNYREHIVESGFEAVGRGDVVTPQMFLKPVTCLIADGDAIPLRSNNVKVGWEVELGVVIGRPARHVDEADAMAHVFGYTILNDVSERGLHAGLAGRRIRERDPFFDWLAGKWFDGFAPSGPWIVEAGDLVDPHALELRLRVNGETRQRGHTGDMIFRIPQLIAAISTITTLEPGDLIATGTPVGAGTGVGDAFLRDGDEVVCEISGIGTLRNPVRRTA
jgi:2,4-didehydro-3-deoxy-L-rhamnonate hydrolase